MVHGLHPWPQETLLVVRRGDEVVGLAAWPPLVGLAELVGSNRWGFPES